MVTANLLRSTTTDSSKLLKSAVKALHINPGRYYTKNYSFIPLVKYFRGKQFYLIIKQ